MSLAPIEPTLRAYLSLCLFLLLYHRTALRSASIIIAKSVSHQTNSMAVLLAARHSFDFRFSIRLAAAVNQRLETMNLSYRLRANESDCKLQCQRHTHTHTDAQTISSAKPFHRAVALQQQQVCALGNERLCLLFLRQTPGGKERAFDAHACVCSCPTSRAHHHQSLNSRPPQAPASHTSSKSSNHKTLSIARLHTFVD